MSSAPGVVDWAAACSGLIETGRRLHARGDSLATSSNYSVRLANDQIALTASGRDKSRLTPADILRLTLAGEVCGDGIPSAETGLHLQLYRRLSGVGAVLHSHSPGVTVLTRCLAPAPIWTVTGMEMAKAFPGISSHEQILSIPLFANDQDIDRLATVVDGHMRDHGEPPAYLITGHGAYVWGPDLATAHTRLEALEFLVRCELDLQRLRPYQAESMIGDQS